MSTAQAKDVSTVLNRTALRPRVLAVASHPIQYQAPWFRALASVAEIDFSVLYVQQPSPAEQGRGFDLAFAWDIPLLEGYRSEQLTDLRGQGGTRGSSSVWIAHPLKLLRQQAPDVLLVMGWHVFPLLQMIVAGRLARVPVIVRGDSNALRRRRWLVRAAHRLLLACCSAFLPVGRNNRDFYLGYGVASEQLFDAPHFVDNDRFSRAAAEAQLQRAELRHRWSIPSDRVCYCYAGKLEPKKRILDLLEALRLAVGESARIHLLVVGSGKLMPQAREVVHRHVLPVTFAGFLNQSEIADAYVASDCLVLPSDFGETWGLVVNEAMACGRPAIVSDRVGCAADLVTPGVTGDIVPFGDAAALAQKLIQLAQDPDKLRAMGQQARSRVTQHYGVQQSIDGALAAMRYVLGAA
jgi:glycosyltransferase involved in cell wall biosynthesis